MTRRVFIEDAEQAAYFDWVRLMASSDERYQTIYAIPNGGHRNVREAARLKRQGVKAGVSDIHVPVSVGERAGLWIELKRPIVRGKPKPKLSPEQVQWLGLMHSFGHTVCLCYGFDQARQATQAYLSNKPLVTHQLLF